MWHVSVSHKTGYAAKRHYRNLCQKVLFGLGRPEKEWTEDRIRDVNVLHVRRLMTDDEMQEMGYPLDIRNTAEADSRIETIAQATSIPIHILWEMEKWRTAH